MTRVALFDLDKLAKLGIKVCFTPKADKRGAPRTQANASLPPICNEEGNSQAPGLRPDLLGTQYPSNPEACSW